MKHTLKIHTSQMFEDCIDQTSLDLMSLRARGVETANAVYDDWVLTEDSFVIVGPMLQEFAADMAFVLRTLVESYIVSATGIEVNLTLSEGVSVSAAAEREATAYFKYRVLMWWYHYRDAELSAMYGTKAEVALNNVFTLCIPRTGTLIGRHY